jgi:hypothetical protein
MKVTVSVCQGAKYDWQSALDFYFHEMEEATKFLDLCLHHGYKCLVYCDEE